MPSRKFLLTLLIAITAITGAACGGGKSIPEANSVDSLGKALEAGGLKVEGPLANGILSSRFFSIPGVKFVASGETVMAYEFETQEAADEERALVSEDGWGIGAKYINWVVAPSYYQNGRLIVIYDGDAAPIRKTLNSAMGERFAGSDPDS